MPERVSPPTSRNAGFTFQLPPELITEVSRLAEPPTALPRYNVALTQQVPVTRRNSDGQDHLDYLRLGLIPPWAQKKSIGSEMIYGRYETVNEKPASGKPSGIVVAWCWLRNFMNGCRGEEALRIQVRQKVTHGILVDKWLAKL
jgi:hypothetical protein